MSFASLLNLGSQWELPPAHPHVDGWLLMDPISAGSVVIAYLLTVFALQQYIRYRGSPFNLKVFVIIHNLNLFALSLYMGIETLRQAWINNYSLFGNGVDSSKSGQGMAQILWIFFLSKVLEFFDTFIMALRARFRQITFLHVYHHASIFCVWWAIVRYAPGGEGYFSCALNSFVHVVMYGYYLWSCLSPKQSSDKKPVWTDAAFYRPYITRIQLSQFVVMLMQATYDLVVPSPYPTAFARLLFVYMLTMLALFGNFYAKAYLKKPSKLESIKEA